MTDTRTPAIEPTAVDDVRRVREKIARQHRGNLRAHVAETNRIAAALHRKLGLKVVGAPRPRKPRSSGGASTGASPGAVGHARSRRAG